MKHESTERITLTLPSALYHTLRNEAYRQGVSLPEFIKKKVELKPSSEIGAGVGVGSDLASLPLEELFRKTEPKQVSGCPDSCIDFYV